MRKFFRRRIKLTILLLKSIYLKSTKLFSSLLGEIASSLGTLGIFRLGDLLTWEPLEDLLERVDS